MERVSDRDRDRELQGQVDRHQLAGITKATGGRGGASAINTAVQREKTTRCLNGGERKTREAVPSAVEHTAGQRKTTRSAL